MGRRAYNVATKYGMVHVDGGDRPPKVEEVERVLDQVRTERLHELEVENDQLRERVRELEEELAVERGAYEIKGPDVV